MYIGIDFGRSFSRVSAIHNGHPFVLLPPNSYGVPSKFYYDTDAGIQIGQDAIDKADIANSGCLVSECKSKLTHSDDTVMLDGKPFKYSQIARHIYGHTVSAAKSIAAGKRFGSDIDGAVLTVPVGFGYREKSIIKEAARFCIDGCEIPVLDVIKEPVAAAISYYGDLLDDGKSIIVFDLGVNTCSVSLLKADSSQKELFSVVDSVMEIIGGDDWDKALMSYIAREVMKKSGVDIENDEFYANQLRNKAIYAKEKLSDGISLSASAAITLQNGRLIPVAVTLGAFEEITYGLIMKAVDCLKNVFTRNMESCNIEEIVCAGGSCKMRQVKYNIQSEFPDVTVRVTEPENAVANGAAIYADMCAKRNELSLSDISAFSYAVRVYENNDGESKKIFYNMITKGTHLPTMGTHLFKTVEDGQDYAAVRIFEGEETSQTSSSDAPYREIGHVLIPLPKNAKKGYKVRCTVTMKGDGFLYFNAEGEDGKILPATFKTSN